ncbi:hypothetical protein [Nocardioides sp. CER19]|uniref:TY-Chap domain-containing protein n=1 Tax=Nocardioides sp. CER19 TaxID=3038538 RepID=UPI002447308C|nr:hypothetical protein [Nocardioides sp. CER19]MDH2414577.1 hypothetical protein [Nocardioides sp. CER19]
MTDAWQVFRDRLGSELVALPVDHSLLVSEPDPPAGPAPARKWWQLGAAGPRAVPGRYVQFLRWEDVVRAECVSGAYRDVSETQHRALLDLGWSDPAANPKRWGTDNYVYDAAPAELAQLADLCARSLDVLGARPDADWRWQVTD